MISVLVPLALLASGIAAGVMLGNAVGLGAFALGLPYERYIDLIKFMWGRYDPFVPILNVLAFVLDIVIAVVVNGIGAPILFGLSAALLAALIAISLTKNVPINKYVSSLDPAIQPADWPQRDPRARWKKWNEIRVVFALVALIAGLAGAAVLL